ncbi:MAG: hypothetical protein LCH61_00950 [Proteobacteria bacterium]|nr:hypothetical protein [Pseudomonadota bacterium]
MTDILKRAADAVEGVTPGPWRIGPDEEGAPAQCITGAGFDICTSWGGYNAADADASFIVAARDLVPEMLGEIAALRAEVKRLQSVDIVNAASVLLADPDTLDGFLGHILNRHDMDATMKDYAEGAMDYLRALAE